MKPIALIFVAATVLIEAGFLGWMAVEFWPDVLLTAICLGAIVVTLPATVFAGIVVDRRLKQIEADAAEPPRPQRRRPIVVERM